MCIRDRHGNAAQGKAGDRACCGRRHSCAAGQQAERCRTDCLLYTSPASYYEKLQARYTEKRDHFLAGLDRVGLKHNVPQGTYFVMIDISDFLALPQFKGWTDLQFCEWMIREVGVAAVPGSSFFREPVNHLIRMHFARGTDVLDEAVRRLEKLQALLK